MCDSQDSLIVVTSELVTVHTHSDSWAPVSGQLVSPTHIGVSSVTFNRHR